MPPPPLATPLPASVLRPVYFQQNINDGRRLTFTVGYSKIKQWVQLWLYFNVFRKSDLWQDINDAILLFFLCKNRHFLGYKMCKYSKLNLNTLALSRCIATRWSTLSDSPRTFSAALLNVAQPRRC